MSHVVMLSRAYQPSYYFSSSLRKCKAVTQLSNCYKSTKADSKELINNVVEDAPVNYLSGFNHQRIRRPETTIPQSKITFKKKDQKIVIYPTLEERLEELDPDLRDPELYKKINIGFSCHQTETNHEKKKREKAILSSLRNDKNLNKLANDHKLDVDISVVQEEWLYEAGPRQTRYLALHCGIFKDLFGPYAYFDAIVPLQVEYDYDEDQVTPVYRGNIIKPLEARSAPTVQYSSPSDALWTLLVTNPDGDLYNADSEACHWLVTNIRGADVSTGEEVVPYLPPVPPRGVGYQRMVFILFRQTQAIQHQHQIDDPFDLRSRTFSTQQFYGQHEDCITPVGLSWYNTDWDTSLPQYYHQTLGMKEPVFEYEFPGPYLTPQVEYPARKDFTAYSDRYRDPKETSKMMFLKRLKKLDPFKKETPRLPFPDAQPISHHLPSWQRQLIKQERLGWGKYSELYRDDYSVDALYDDATLTEAATVEVEKNHSIRASVWQKLHLGIKKRRVIAKQQDEEDTQERINRVTVARLD